jgi:hypothetical protein
MDQRFSRGIGALQLIPMSQIAFRSVFKQLQVPWRPPIEHWEIYESLPSVPRWLFPTILFLFVLYLDVM